MRESLNQARAYPGAASLLFEAHPVIFNRKAQLATADRQ